MCLDSNGAAILLGEHVALQCLHPYAQSYLVNGLAQIGSSNPMVQASSAEHYAQAVLSRVGELDGALASLRLVRRFVDEHCQASDPDPEVYRYHYENFVFRGIGVVDRAYLLVADALLLSKRASKSNQQIDAQIEQYPQVQVALQAVKATLQPYRKPRNSIAHESAYSNRNLGVLTAVRHFNFELDGIDVPALGRELFAASATEIGDVIEHLTLSLQALFSSFQAIFEWVASSAAATDGKAASEEAAE